mmetsp:Transcript_63823/g.201897  ORF Transcript_63823/g.201897 Transcript_63823/m.201897 type:complete len:274 (-) Transcript_63823:4117-4938(-)
MNVHQERAHRHSDAQEDLRLYPKSAAEDDDTQEGELAEEDHALPEIRILVVRRIQEAELGKEIEVPELIFVEAQEQEGAEGDPQRHDHHARDTEEKRPCHVLTLPAPLGHVLLQPQAWRGAVFVGCAIHCDARKQPQHAIGRHRPEVEDDDEYRDGHAVPVKVQELSRPIEGLFDLPHGGLVLLGLHFLVVIAQAHLDRPYDPRACTLLHHRIDRRVVVVVHRHHGGGVFRVHLIRSARLFLVRPRPVEHREDACHAHDDEEDDCLLVDKGDP